MSARDSILARIRAAQGKPMAVTDAERQAVGVYLERRAIGPRPEIPGDPVALFRARALALASTVAAVDALSDVPSAVAQYLHGSGLPSKAACWREFSALDWRAAGVEVEFRAAGASDAVGITGAFCGIAETGTLVLASGAETPAATSLLPETHVAIIRTARVVAGMEDAWRLLRCEMQRMPRAVNFVSGPSRTADIEQTVTLGAHGPYRVHVILIGDSG